MVASCVSITSTRACSCCVSYVHAVQLVVLHHLEACAVLVAVIISVYVALVVDFEFDRVCRLHLVHGQLANGVAAERAVARLELLRDYTKSDPIRVDVRVDFVVLLEADRFEIGPELGGVGHRDVRLEPCV